MSTASHIARQIKQFAVAIILWWYRCIVNPLMEKNATHKLTTFYFSIDDLSASLSCLFLLNIFLIISFESEMESVWVFKNLNRTDPISGLRHTSSKSWLYRICENEQNRRCSLSTLDCGLRAMTLKMTCNCFNQNFFYIILITPL